MSVVLKLMQDGDSIALIPGDMSSSSLDFIKSEGSCIKSKILVFPHHGGLPHAGDAVNFAKELCDLVEPEIVLFSNGRNRHSNPRVEVLNGIKASVCTAGVACTQLSEACCVGEESLSDQHLSELLPSKGGSRKHSCSGSISIKLKGADTDVLSPFEKQGEYVKNFPKRKCLVLESEG
ncbi:hypothetical protein [Microbulbifer pacificus]|uniref:hypothetical protein n=1 Tax=Microbulbifer pacificus TaxID=407164 RepID=UPI00131A1824|nr:hypothetical protein [Microbulbifer pacificus]